MSDELPKGWARTTLGRICSKLQYGWTLHAGCKKARTQNTFAASDISEGNINWQRVRLL